jgi:ELWxxDGT repeat protein
MQELERRRFLSADLKGTLIFAGHDSEHGSELWKSDGTAAGTTLPADLVPGAVGSGPDEFTTVGDSVYFVAGDGNGASQLWRTN